jgi:iron complex outermembrane receptor protein
MKASFWLSASAVALMSTAAQAQTAPGATTDPTAAARADTTMSTDVVVTAERRSTGLQRTAVAATVLTGEDLTRKSILSVEQLQFATPSLTVNTSGQSNSFNIRGIGKTEVTSSIGVGVVTYRDGVATFPGYFQTEPYYDISSVEVLRGPQGTFAGGNATGGAVFITETNPTTDKVKGYALAQYGNYNDAKVQGAINLPLSTTLALRVAGNYERRDTFFKVTGPFTGNPGNLDSISGRASLLWQPDSHLRVLIKGDYNKVNYGGFPAGPAYLGTAAAPTPNTADPFTVTSNAPLSGQDEFGRISANISYTFDNGLAIRSISGYQAGTTQERVDSDGTSTGTDTFQDFAHEHIWSQEVNIVSPDSGRFTWLLGGYLQRDNYVFPANGGYRALSPTGALQSLEIIGANPHTATAVFGQLGYKLTDSLQITVGGRWSRTTSRNDASYPVTVFIGFLNNVPQFINTTLVQHDFAANKKVDGKVALNWTIDSHNFVYAFVATGSKAGGLNGLNLFGVAPRSFEPEQVTDYELGWKGTLMNGHLRTQVGAYYNRYKNFQVSIVDPAVGSNFNSIFNVPNATKLYGVEASAQGSFGDFLFDASLSLSHSEVGNFYAFDPRVAHAGACDPAVGPTSATCVALGGRRQTYAPQFTLSGGMQYAFQLGNDMTLTPRVDYAHISAAWGTLFQQPALGDYLGERNIVNTQLTLAKGNWSIGGFATNLTNQHYIAALNGTRRMPGLPRQYGVRASTKF